MNKSNLQPKKLRSIIDEFFSLQWCRDNLVVPVSLEPSLPPTPPVLTIAVANIIFLGTIGQTIKERLRNTNYKCNFIEISTDEIQEILDLAAEQRLISGESVNLDEFTEDAVLEALQES